MSADPETRDEVRGLVLALDDDVDLHESEYQPPQETDGFWAPRGEARRVQIT